MTYNLGWREYIWKHFWIAVVARYFSLNCSSSELLTDESSTTHACICLCLRYAMSSLYVRNSIICYLLFNLPRDRKVYISRLISRQSDYDVTNESISTLVSLSNKIFEQRKDAWRWSEEIDFVIVIACCCNGISSFRNGKLGDRKLRGKRRKAFFFGAAGRPTNRPERYGARRARKRSIQQERVLVKDQKARIRTRPAIWLF